MKKLGLNEIREKYLAFFKSKDHLRLSSFPLVPKNDPSILLINAGMTPLKPYFTGQEEPPHKRVTTCQKCIRTPDIERVGKTARHATFFEMLGNFSFGDYFKREAIAWAWEFVTEVMEMPIEKLYVSIYENDNDAFEIWSKDIGIPKEKIVRLGKEDNFWEHGLGPCGPCSEIYYDRGIEYGCGNENCEVGCDCDRFIEFWNLVFTQFDKDENGNYNSLPNPNIDTGMGLERLATIMQGVDSIYDVDTIKNILEHVSKLAGVKYMENSSKDVSLRVITDHIRSTAFMISDGILPSNEGRGYVLRRLLRRAARHGKLLGINDTFLWKIVDTVVKESGEAYPELIDKKDYLVKVIKVEEERFNETIDQGLVILNQHIEELKEKNTDTLSGDKAFKLYDTYGFPLDLTLEILDEYSFKVDKEKFDDEMNAQRERARAAKSGDSKEAWGADVFGEIDKSIKTDFLGYGEFTVSAKILSIVEENNIIDSAKEGSKVTIILDKTPFYGESGGQVGDIGIIENDNATLKVLDTKKTNDGKYLHVCKVEKGSVKVGDIVNSKIDIDRRISISRNHSATHLLQKALENVLGNHVAQAGSYVSPERLRFDFSHFASMTEDEIKAVEKEVNTMVLKSLQVDVMEKSISEARKMGAKALFGEKYGDVVRIVKMGDYSMELCGGCHVELTSQIGTFKIISESGVAAGVRRIEAITGFAALNYYENKEKLLNEVAKVLKTKEEDIVKKAENIIEDYKKANKEIEQLRNKLVKDSLDEYINNAVDVDGIKVVTVKIDNADIEVLRNTSDKIRDKLECGVIVLATANEGKVNFVTMATKTAVEKGIHAGNIIREVAKVTGGGGGGRPDVAQAGGKDASKIDDALNIVVSLVEKQKK
jgi:alanyl-tRNA synthetase